MSVGQMSGGQMVFDQKTLHLIFSCRSAAFVEYLATKIAAEKFSVARTPNLGHI
jgi:hypothetical protein